MSEIKLSWSSAEVDDARLTVPLEGEIPRGWRTDFETTVKRLGSGEWGEVEVKKDKVRVSDVTPGSEAKLRHHLESIVEQANASHAARQREKAAKEEDEGEKREGPDAEMTERFRAFAEPEGGDSGGGSGDSDH
jgi:hypothetical protein